MQIEALATIPFINGRLYFLGRISLTEFYMRAEASFAAGPFALDAKFEILVSTTQLRLAFGGKVALGPMGNVAVYGVIQASPAYFALNGTFCKPMLGFDMSGSASIDSRTMTMAFQARAVIGFMGIVELQGSVSPSRLQVRARPRLPPLAPPLTTTTHSPNCRRPRRSTSRGWSPCSTR